jgi:hypothetical protein
MGSSIGIQVGNVILSEAKNPSLARERWILRFAQNDMTRLEGEVLDDIFPSESLQVFIF